MEQPPVQVPVPAIFNRGPVFFPPFSCDNRTPREAT